MTTDLIVPGGYIHRAVPLEDISIKPGDGRTVEAYLAVFDTEAEIADGQGHYKEVIDRAAFNKSVNDARPQGSRSGWKTSVFYNHAMTPYGTPSDRWSTPVAVTQEIVVESRGVRAIDRYSKTADADHVLELIRDGAVQGYSFTGRILRSDPMRAPRGGFRPGRDGGLQVVRRLELGLSEYGPTPSPAYETAGVVGVRANFDRLLAAAGITRDQALQFMSTTPDEEPDDIDTSDLEAVADEPQEHSVRHDPFKRRLAVALRARGIQP